MDKGLQFIDFSNELCSNINNLIKLTWPITRDRLRKQGIKLEDVTKPEQAMKIIEEVVEYTTEVYTFQTDNPQYEKADHENLDILFAWLALQHISNDNAGIKKFDLQMVLKKFMERGWLNFQ